MYINIDDEVCCQGQLVNVIDIRRPLGTFRIYIVKDKQGNTMSVNRHEISAVDHFSDSDEWMMDIPLTNLSNGASANVDHCIAGDNVKISTHTSSKEEIGPLQGGIVENIRSFENVTDEANVGNVALGLNYPSLPKGTGDEISSGDVAECEIVSKNETSHENIRLCSRFAKNMSPEEVNEFIHKQKNPRTLSKTQGHVNLFSNFLKSVNETRPILELSPFELNGYLQRFFIVVRKHNGEEYEPVSLRSMLGSFERYIRNNNYSDGTFSLISSPVFSGASEALSSKQKALKKWEREISLVKQIFLPMQKSRLYIQNSCLVCLPQSLF